MAAYTALAAVGLAFVHLFSGKLRFLDAIPRSRWLSAAGGSSVAYVFLHLLPELIEAQAVIEGAVTGVLEGIDHHVFLVAFLGLVTFYGLERAARRSRRTRQRAGHGDATSPRVFWLHVVSFSLYNGLVGYLLVQRPRAGLGELALFAVAMALHFVVTDYGLRQDHKEAYARVGRWILAAAILLGWGLALLTDVSELVLVLLLAFLAGGVILNVLKEELPEERESRFSAFLLGALVYAALLLVAG